MVCRAAFWGATAAIPNIAVTAEHAIDHQGVGIRGAKVAVTGATR